MRALKCLRNIEIIRKKHEMAVAKQQSEAWRKALDGVPDSLRMLLEINNTENVPEDSVKVESISKNGKFKCIMEPYPGNELDF